MKWVYGHCFYVVLSVVVVGICANLFKFLYAHISTWRPNHHGAEMCYSIDGASSFYSCCLHFSYILQVQHIQQVKTLKRMSQKINSILFKTHCFLTA
jgi:hypothetical protein